MNAPIELELTFTALCCNEPENCPDEWTKTRLIAPHQLTVEVGSFRHQIYEDLTNLGWLCDQEGGWYCPRHADDLPLRVVAKKEAA